MSPSKQCKAYQCTNGAPYGNAFGDGSLAAIAVGLANQERVGRDLLGYIEFVGEEARRNLEWRGMRGNVGRVVGIYLLLNLVGENNTLFGESLTSCVWMLVKCIGVILMGALVVLCILGLYWLVFGLFQPIPRPRDRRGGRAAGLNFRTEDEMISEAIARSLAEQ